MQFALSKKRECFWLLFFFFWFHFPGRLLLSPVFFQPVLMHRFFWPWVQNFVLLVELCEVSVGSLLQGPSSSEVVLCSVSTSPQPQLSIIHKFEDEPFITIQIIDKYIKQHWLQSQPLEYLLPTTNQALSHYCYTWGLVIQPI